MLAIVDIDCTLYSYCELFLSQKDAVLPALRRAARRRAGASLEKEEAPRFWHEGADRACLKYRLRIEERARLLADLFLVSALSGGAKTQAGGSSSPAGSQAAGRPLRAAACKPLLYTSYPLTQLKKSLFSPLPFRLHSSFPKKKSADEALKLCGKRADLVIGDRKEDRELARALGAVWRGFAFYDFHHLLRGAAYTEALLSLAEEGARAAAAPATAANRRRDKSGKL